MRTRTVADIGEIALIERIRRRVAGRGAGRASCRGTASSCAVVRGIGDDCAVVRAPGAGPRDLLLTSDPVIEGVHFESGTRPELIGRKAVGRILSDIAAMGGEPAWALIDVVARPGTRVGALDGIYRGASSLARRHGLAIVGGDVSSGRALELHVFAVGFAPRGRAVLRSGARPGDVLFVTGSVGGSGAGRHLRFEPRVREGMWLRNRATAMIDVSDGLASDARHLAEAGGVGVRLDLSLIPVSRDVKASNRTAALRHALHDGEDFELLFALPRSRSRALVSAWQRRFDLPCTAIGAITARRGVLEYVGADGIVREAAETGFQHFKPARIRSRRRGRMRS